jgi:hypothetical protein
MPRIIYETSTTGETYPVLRCDWHLEDIMFSNEVDYPNMTKEQALRIMERIMHTHDANIGVNWEVIEYATEAIMDEDGIAPFEEEEK